jgi:hypothetical protein
MYISISPVPGVKYALSPEWVLPSQPVPQANGIVTTNVLSVEMENSWSSAEIMLNADEHHLMVTDDEAHIMLAYRLVNPKVRRKKFWFLILDTSEHVDFEEKLVEQDPGACFQFDVF